MLPFLKLSKKNFHGILLAFTCSNFAFASPTPTWCIKANTPLTPITYTEDGTIYAMPLAAMNNEPIAKYLSAISTAGKVKWTILIDTHRDIYGPSKDQDGNLYFRIMQPGHCIIRKIAKNGETLFEYKIFGGMYPLANQLIVGSNLYSYILMRDSRIIALDATGKLAWRMAMPEDNSARNASMVLDTANNLYIGLDNSSILSIAANGQKRWLYSQLKNAITALVISTDKLYVSDAAGDLHILSLHGEYLASLSLHAKLSKLQRIASNTVLATGEQQFFIIEGSKIKWQSAANTIFTAPFVDNKQQLYTYNLSAETLNAYAALDGKVLWTYHSAPPAEAKFSYFITSAAGESYLVYQNMLTEQAEFIMKIDSQGQLKEAYYKQLFADISFDHQANAYLTELDGLCSYT